MRRASKIDSNQPEIIAALRKAGCSVQPLNSVGDGCPDIAVGRAGLNFFLEIKDGQKPPSARKLTPDQQDWHGSWRGQVAIVKSVEEALKEVGL